MPTSKTQVTEREVTLVMALHQAIVQLEGWVAWKCPKAHKAEHEAFIANLRAVCGNTDPQHRAAAALIQAKVDADAVLRDEALHYGLDALLTMIPAYCKAAGLEPCTAAFHDEAIHRAAIAVHGPDATYWPRHLVDVVAGKLR